MNVSSSVVESSLPADESSILPTANSDVPSEATAVIGGLSSSEGTDGFRFLVATDIHVGYAERDALRADDSVNTFEEILQLAKEKDVDFILLAGDLFHENKPSREMQHRVTRLLRRYCLGDRPVPIQFKSDSSVNFSHSHFSHVNYEDPNFNVAMPVFSIHGNHDDLSGKGLSELDVLHESGLLNLFGKFENCTEYDVSPILLQKGNAKLALYGISSQRDDRLHRAFLARNVRFLRPNEDPEQWFSVMAFHQNRPHRAFDMKSIPSHIPEHYLPDFLDLVVWGHEHECKIEPKYRTADFTNRGDGFFIMQPGSTVATSLSMEEAGDKKIAIVSVKGRQFKSNPITLRSVRQFYWDELVLEQIESIKPPRVNDRSRGMLPDEEVAYDKVHEMIALAKREHRPSQPKLPLIRLRVVYSGIWMDYEPFSIQRFGQQFVDKVANPKDLLIFKKERERHEKVAPVDRRTMERLAKEQAKELQSTVEDLVTKYFGTLEKNEERLRVLTETGLGVAVREYVNKEDDGAIADLVDSQLDAHRTRLQQCLDNARNEGDLDSQNLSSEELNETIVHEMDRIQKENVQHNHGIIPTTASSTAGSDDIMEMSVEI